MLFVKKSYRGVVLLFVMGMIFLIGIVVTQFLLLAHRELYRRARIVYEGDFRREAMSLFMLSMGVISECHNLDKGVYSPLQGWSKPLKYTNYILPEGWEGDVSVYDDTGKIPISQSTEPGLLKTLFLEMGWSDADSALLTDSLLDWVDSNENVRPNGAESSFYQTLEPSYFSANEPLKRLSDIYFIQGFRERFFNEAGEPNIYYQWLRDSICPRRHRGYINPNTASDLVLRTLSKYYKFNYEETKRRLDGPDGIRGTTDDQAVRNISHLGLKKALPGKPLDWWSAFFRIEIDLRRGDVSYRLTVLLERQPRPKNASKTAKKSITGDDFPDAQFFWGGWEG